jgi:hypothetical protein
MADLHAMTDVELEHALQALASTYPYPPTPDLHAAVRNRIVTQPFPSRRAGWRWTPAWRLATVAAIALILVAGALFINPLTRDAIAHFFHVQGVTVNRTSSTPATPSPSASPLSSLNLGEATTLEKAQAAVSFSIVVPPQLGVPDAIYLQDDVPGGAVALAYKPRPGLPEVKETGLGALITEFRGDLVPGFITKEVGPGTTAQEVSVHGDAGWWIEGQPHTIIVQFSPTTSDGVILRLAANTLVWGHNGVTYRIESGLTESEAMAIAAAMP